MEHLGIIPGHKFNNSLVIMISYDDRLLSFYDDNNQKIIREFPEYARFYYIRDYYDYNIEGTFIYPSSTYGEYLFSELFDTMNSELCDINECEVEVELVE